MKLLYWVREALKVTCIIIAAAFIYALLMAVQDGENIWQYYLYLGSLYSVFFGAFTSMLLNTAIYQLHLPLAICFGSTRKEAVAGIQCYRFIIALLVLSHAWITGVLVKDALAANPFAVMPAGIGAFLIFNGMGSVLGGFSTKLGKTAMIVISIVIMLMVVVAVGAVALAIGLKFGLLSSVVWAVFGIGIFVYALCMILEVKTIQKFSVK